MICFSAIPFRYDLPGAFFIMKKVYRRVPKVSSKKSDRIVPDARKPGTNPVFLSAALTGNPAEYALEAVELSSTS